MIDFPIVDTHVHLLDTERFRYSWTKNAPSLLRDWTVDDLCAMASPYVVDKIVFVEVDVDMLDYVDEGIWVQSLADKDPRIQGCVACLPMEKGAAVEADMAQFADLKIVRGIRRLIQNQPDPEWVLRPEVIESTRLLAKYNLSFDLCIFHHQLENTIRFVKQCPDVFFILDHIAKPGIKTGEMEPWARQLRELAELPNVVCKLSGVTTEADHAAWTREQLRPYIDHVIECFGFDRLMYGGDWPVSELAGAYPAWVEVLDWATSGCSRDEKRKLFRDNGIRDYRLL